MNEMEIPHCRLNFLENFAKAGGFWLIALHTCDAAYAAFSLSTMLMDAPIHSRQLRCSFYIDPNYPKDAGIQVHP